MSYGTKLGPRYGTPEYNELRDKAEAKKITLDLSDLAKYMSLGLGLHHGQAGTISLNPKGEHGTSGVVHVALTEDNKLVIAVEVEPGIEVEVREVVRRPRWKFRDYWGYDPDAHDNYLLPESEWPTA